MKLCRFIAVLPCLLAAASAVAADIYSWRDAEGHLHYSDSPPTGSIDIQKRHARSTAETAAAATTGATKSRTLAEKDQDFRKRRSEAADADTKSAKEKADAAQRQEDCRNLRGNLAALEGGQRISHINEKGETEIIDDSRRQSDTERTRRQIEQTCK